MVWSVDWDGPFVVGGDHSRRLTPNFRLREFRRPDGTFRVHRELVSALQILRDRYGHGLSVSATDADGLGATLRGESAQALLEAADALEAHHLFSVAEIAGDEVRVRIPDPGRLPDIGLAQALETAFSVTAAFETAGDRFQQVTGNFDGAGLSFGPAQVNFGTGTLEPLFAAFRQADEATLAGCFGNDEDYREWTRVLALPRRQQIAWADGLSTGRGKHDVVDPWKSYLRAVGRVPRFREIMVERILRDYGAKLLRAIEHLHKLSAGIRIDHLRCVCALYDLVIQQGSLDKASTAIAARIESERPRDQFELVRIAVEERGRTASSRWRADCLSRRLGILSGVPTTSNESGTETQRANINFYMLRDVRIARAAELIDADVSAELANASRHLAEGTAQLA